MRMPFPCCAAWPGLSRRLHFAAHCPSPIIYGAWDGEEAALIGSTEWAETHADELQKKAVLYVNSDNNARGFLSVGGSHTLERFMNDVARDVVDPEKEIPVFDRWRAHLIID